MDSVLPTILYWFTLLIFAVSTVALAVYGLHLYVLLWLFTRRIRTTRESQKQRIADFWRTARDEDLPFVTCQIPVYNEANVVERVMVSVAAILHPRDRFEVQVLDDSTDQTSTIIDSVSRELEAAGTQVRIVRRSNREGFKAGALALGTETARGEYLAVFDADFAPPPDFLRIAIPLIHGAPDVACLQGRWGHLNREESWLTGAQALGIDAHFAIEQGARAWNGMMMNFNGTAGIWRKAAITDANVGGWSGDTLTEDLDLSYRAQLGGWRIDYCIDLECPAELPNTVGALKGQQRRWATGSIQVARKLLGRVWKSPRSFSSKIEATLHLTHYSVAVWMLLLAIVARPMLLVFTRGLVSAEVFWIIWSLVLASAIAPSFAYAYARYSLGEGWTGLRMIPAMLVVGCGLCVSNSLAVVRGLFLRGGEFVRTPKSGSDRFGKKSSSYRTHRDHLWIAEMLLGAYSAISFAVYLTEFRTVFSAFLLIYAVGFFVIGWMSRPKSRRLDQNGPPLLSTSLEEATVSSTSPASQAV